MCGLCDNLTIHKCALDIVIKLMKKEQLDERVPLYGVEKAINHFEHLLQTCLVEANLEATSLQLLDQMKAMTAGSHSIYSD